jgi:hypothetical protein
MYFPSVQAIKAAYHNIQRILKTTPLQFNNELSNYLINSNWWEYSLEFLKKLGFDVVNHNIKTDYDVEILSKLLIKIGSKSNFKLPYSPIQYFSKTDFKLSTRAMGSIKLLSTCILIYF